MRLPAAALVSCLALVGCGESKLDTAELESQLGEQLSADGEPSSVQCPEDVTIEEGKRFTCTLNSSSGESRVLVTLTSDSGDFQARLLLNTPELEAELKQQLGEDAGVEPRAVECPDDVPIERGRQFDCILTAPNGEEVPVNVTLTDEQGGFRAEVPPAE